MQVGLWPPGSCFQALSPCPHPLPPTCRSFSAVGLFLGFLVKASLRKWWKFWVLVGTRAPRPRSALMQGILPTAPCWHSRGLREVCPGKGQPEARGRRPEQHCCGDAEAPPSTTTVHTSHGPEMRPGPLPQMVCRIPEGRALEAAPWELADGSSTPLRTDRKGGPSKKHGPHQRVLSLSLGGWKLLLDMSIKALRTAEGQELRVNRTPGVRQGASVQLTSWGAGGREGAAARPAQWL